MKSLLLIALLWSGQALAQSAPTAGASLSTGSEAQARALGWDNGNAGDIYTAEFILTARDLLPRMKLLPQSELAGIDMVRLAGSIANASVHSEATLELNGYPVDAKNYPDRQEIILNRARWRVLRTPQETSNRLMLVLHEYLFLAGVDDTQFRVSGRLVPQLNVQNFNPNRWWNPLNPVNRVTLNLEYSPEGCTVSSLDFNLQSGTEEVSTATSGSCGDAFRRITVRKNSFTAPPSSGARGTFHRYEVMVRDQADSVLGAFTYEPEWGQCLLPQDGNCQLSGKIFVGGVELHFWLMR